MDWQYKQYLLEHHLIEDNEDDDDDDIPYELESETQFKQYLRFEILLKNRFKTYCMELANYYVNFTDDPTITAGVDADNRLIVINEGIVQKILTGYGSERRELEAFLSMLIRHELLHALLKHKKRTIIHIAQKYGYDPFNMTEEQYAKVMRVYYKPSILMRDFNRNPETGEPGQIKISNGAGDLDLSRYYIEKDIELNRNQGGLILEDHPDWVGYSFEEILAALEEKQKRLYLRLKPIVYGELDPETKEFKVDHEDEPHFATTTSFDPEDVVDIRLATLDEAFEYSKRHDISEACWLLNDNSKQPDPSMALYWDGTYRGGYIAVNTPLHILAVLKIENLDLYKKVFDSLEEHRQQYAEFECFGRPVFILPTGTVIIDGLLTDDNNKPMIEIFDSKTNDFTKSSIKRVLKMWLQTEIKKFS